jgi:hypothetical protein
MKAFMVEKSWQETKNNCQPGQTTFTTEEFPMDGESWAIVWAVEEAEMKITVYESGSPMPSRQVNKVVNTQCGQGIFYLQGPGVFGLEIQADGEWVVKAVSVG